jgi:ATP-binding cassette subfamily B protein
VRPHLAPHRWLIVGGMAALLSSVGFAVLEPWPVKFVVDGVVRSLGADLAGAPAVSGAGLLVGSGLLLIVIVVLRAVAGYLSTVAFALVGSRVATDLRSYVFSHVQSLSRSYHSRASTGDTVQRMVGDVGRLQEVAVTAGLPLLASVITLVVMCIVMFALDPLLTAVVAGAALAYLLTSRRSTRKITVAAPKTRKGEGSLASTAHETLGAITVVQAYGLEKVVAGRFGRGNSAALTEGVRARRLAAALERRTDVLVGLASAIVLAGGGWRVLTQAITPGDLVIFLMYLKIAMKPLKDLAKYTGRIARAAASGERVADVLDETIEVAERPLASPLAPVRGSIEFRGVHATDGRGQELFRGVDLRIPAGQNVCLLGASGAGKSTLMSLLLRFADPARGAVCIDGVDVRDATLESLRSGQAIVLQDSILFATTVRENIRYGRLDASDADVERAAADVESSSAGA